MDGAMGGIATAGGVPMEKEGDVILSVTKVKLLKEKVDALIRSMQGAGDAQQGQKTQHGLERALMWDGFDIRTQQHTGPSLAKKQMLEHFKDAVVKLDEVTLGSGGRCEQRFSYRRACGTGGQRSRGTRAGPDEARRPRRHPSGAALQLLRDTVLHQ
jgi:hypothetical protein